MWEHQTIELEVSYGLGLKPKFDQAGFVSVLNEQAKNGWELVSSFTLDGGMGGTHRVVLVLRRKLPADH